MEVDSDNAGDADAGEGAPPPLGEDDLASGKAGVFDAAAGGQQHTGGAVHKPPAALAGLAGSKAAPAFGIESDSEAVNPDDVAGTSGPSLKEQQQHKCQGDYTAEGHASKSAPAGQGNFWIPLEDPSVIWRFVKGPRLRTKELKAIQKALNACWTARHACLYKEHPREAMEKLGLYDTYCNAIGGEGNIMYYEKIKEKLNLGLYESVAAFLADLRAITHNSDTYCKQHATDALYKVAEHHQAVEKIITKCKLGEMAGHSIGEPTCDSPDTCQVCDKASTAPTVEACRHFCPGCESLIESHKTKVNFTYRVPVTTALVRYCDKCKAERSDGLGGELVKEKAPVRGERVPGLWISCSECGKGVHHVCGLVDGFAVQAAVQQEKTPFFLCFVCRGKSNIQLPSSDTHAIIPLTTVTLDVAPHTKLSRFVEDNVRAATGLGNLYVREVSCEDITPGWHESIVDKLRKDGDPRANNVYQGKQRVLVMTQRHEGQIDVILAYVKLEEAWLHSGHGLVGARHAQLKILDTVRMLQPIGKRRGVYQLFIMVIELFYLLHLCASFRWHAQPPIHANSDYVLTRKENDQRTLEVRLEALLAFYKRPALCKAFSGEHHGVLDQLMQLARGYLLCEMAVPAEREEVVRSRPSLDMPMLDIDNRQIFEAKLLELIQAEPDTPIKELEQRAGAATEQAMTETKMNIFVVDLQANRGQQQPAEGAEEGMDVGEEEAAGGNFDSFNQIVFEERSMLVMSEMNEAGYREVVQAAQAANLSFSAYKRNDGHILLTDLMSRGRGASSS